MSASNGRADHSLQVSSDAPMNIDELRSPLELEQQAPAQGIGKPSVIKIRIDPQYELPTDSLVVIDQVPSASLRQEDCTDPEALRREVEQNGQLQDSQSPYANIILESTGLGQPPTTDQREAKAISREHINTTSYRSVPAARGATSVTSKSAAKGAKGRRPKNTSIEWL